eukprot:scaffold193421_cov24-Tisochrysis_lutea.AAC.2
MVLVQERCRDASGALATKAERCEEGESREPKPRSSQQDALPSPQGCGGGFTEKVEEKREREKKRGRGQRKREERGREGEAERKGGRKRERERERGREQRIDGVWAGKWWEVGTG